MTVRGEPSPQPGPSQVRRARLLFALGAAPLLILGLILRLDRWPFHANVWGIDWLNYYELQARHLHAFEPLGFLVSWEGLHPPVSGILHGLGMVLGVGFPVHWAATTAASLAGPAILAAWLRPRSGAVAALLMLTWVMISPQQANYALNASPYPWYLLLGSASTVAFSVALERGPERGGPTLVAAAVLGALAIQTHVLAFAIVIAQAIFFAAQGIAGARAWGRRGVRAAGWIGASSLWMIGGAVFKTTDPWTFHVGEAEGGARTEALRILTSRFGDVDYKVGLFAVMGLLAAAALRGPHRKAAGLILLQVGGILAALLLFFEIGVADPRLSHYYVLPQLLLCAVAALGIGSFTGRARVAVLGLAVALSIPWAIGAFGWQARVSAAAQAEIGASDAAAILPFVADAGPGDVVVYLWDPVFLNDEPEHLDPITAIWPMHRFGRPCWDETPRMFCATHAGAYFYTAPWGYWGALHDVEEPLRIAINRGRAPGRATIVISPVYTEAPSRPWPVETWLERHGGVNQDYPSGVVAWQMPAGFVMPDPPMDNAEN